MVEILLLCSLHVCIWVSTKQVRCQLFWSLISCSVTLCGPYYIPITAVKCNYRGTLNGKSYFTVAVTLQYWSLKLLVLHCDHIGRFIALWATFQSLWQQLFSPNCPHSEAIFVKVSKYFIILVKSFLDNFYRHLVIFFWSH